MKSISYLAQWWFGRIDGNGDDGGGESYAALINRINEAKAKLAEFPTGSRVVVVSHTVFINLFLAHMNSPKPMSLLRAIATFIRIKLLENGSVTHLTYDKETGIWGRVNS